METQENNTSFHPWLNLLRKYGHHLSDMIMPNLSVFIAWGLLTIVTQYISGPLHDALLEVDEMMIRFLLPILIGFTGGRLVEKTRGGVVAAIATIGVIVSSSVPQLMGAMVIGPLTGFLVRVFDRILMPKVKAGYEMLVRNFSAGVIGALMCCAGILLLGPTLEWLSLQSYQVIAWLIQRNLLPVANIFLEPLKVLFFNNAINHGILTPLGMEGVRQSGYSILFLIEANPGPGIGLLLAYMLFAKKTTRASASGALLIHAVGGIHEIYFPFVLMNPLLFLAVIAGGVSGTAFFQLFNVGLIAPASPGSVVAILANTPVNKLLGVVGGIMVSSLASFMIAAVIIKQDKKISETKRKEPPLENIQAIVFACDAGMGSSAMGANLLQRQLRAEHIDLPVSYTSVYQLEDDPKLLIITQAEFQAIVEERAPSARKAIIVNFVDQTEYRNLVKQLVERERQKPEEIIQIVEPKIIREIPYKEIIFLYAEEVRGSQTMGVQVLKNILQQNDYELPVSKAAIETVLLDPQNLYIMTKEFAKAHPLSGVPVLLVDHLLTTDYQTIWEGGFQDVSITSRAAALDRVDDEQ